ncbi:nucleic acid-binding, OB-fold, replication protein A, OB domain protein [Tanacetum coccineum]|uniref:Nucleic acid-binding, OB-fold, replication protein A, OB domain protein n=1 Tax=Tanacetum coccineum TaxID=301880 RepID=A0ABQ5FBH7_9ASTR
MDTKLTKVSELTPFRDDWKVKVRVIRLWKLPDFSNPLVTYSLDMVLMDEEVALSDFGVTVRTFESLRNEVRPSTVAYDVIGEVVSCGAVDYPIIEGKAVKQLRFELQDTKGIRLSITLWGPYAEQVDAALGDRTKMSILIMQFAKHKIYRGKPALSNLFNCTRLFVNEDIPDIINFRKSVVAIVGTETTDHRIAPLVNYKRISVRDEFLTHLEKSGCRACNFGVDTILKDYIDEDIGVVKKKTIYTCKSKSCGDVTDVLYNPTDYNLSKNKYVYGISQICEEADVIEELELKVSTIQATVSSSLTPSLGFISPPSRLTYQDSSASATGATNSLIESLKDTGTSPIKRKLEDVIDVDELSNASSTKKKLLDPKIEKE